MATFYRRLPRFEYLEPHSIDEALSLLSQYRGKARIMAGGTDILPKLKRREIPAPEYLVALNRIREMDRMRHGEVDGLSLGALVSIRAVETSPIVRERFPVLREAAESMASAQVRNRGTIAGNLCNAAPSADAAPALLCLDARLTVASEREQRTIKIEDFFTGPHETILAPGEMLQEIHVPNPPPESQGTYLKLTPRSAMDLAVVGVAVVVACSDGICSDIRIALGAVAPTPMRARRAEDILRGHELSNDAIERTARTAAAECCPITDHRASAEYRCNMVEVLTKRAIQQAIV